jgi:hypothetical protein
MVPAPPSSRTHIHPEESVITITTLEVTGSFVDLPTAV